MILEKLKADVRRPGRAVATCCHQRRLNFNNVQREATKERRKIAAQTSSASSTSRTVACPRTASKRTRRLVDLAAGPSTLRPPVGQGCSRVKATNGDNDLGGNFDKAIVDGMVAECFSDRASTSSATAWSSSGSTRRGEGDQLVDPGDLQRPAVHHRTPEGPSTSTSSSRAKLTELTAEPLHRVVGLMKQVLATGAPGEGHRPHRPRRRHDRNAGCSRTRPPPAASGMVAQGATRTRSSPLAWPSRLASRRERSRHLLDVMLLLGIETRGFMKLIDEYYDPTKKSETFMTARRSSPRSRRTCSRVVALEDGCSTRRWAVQLVGHPAGARKDAAASTTSTSTRRDHQRLARTSALEPATDPDHRRLRTRRRNRSSA